jgi:hypothetical protein
MGTGDSIVWEVRRRGYSVNDDVNNVLLFDKIVSACGYHIKTHIIFIGGHLDSNGTRNFAVWMFTRP